MGNTIKLIEGTGDGKLDDHRNYEHYELVRSRIDLFWNVPVRAALLPECTYTRAMSVTLLSRHLFILFFF